MILMTKKKPLISEGKQNVIMVVAIIVISIFAIPMAFSEIEESKERFKLIDPDRIEFINVSKTYNIKYFHESGIPLSPATVYDKDAKAGIIAFCDDGYVSIKNARLFGKDFDVKTDKQTVDTFCGVGK